MGTSDKQPKLQKKKRMNKEKHSTTLRFSPHIRSLISQKHLYQVLFLKRFSQTLIITLGNSLPTMSGVFPENKYFVSVFSDDYEEMSIVPCTTSLQARIFAFMMLILIRISSLTP